MTTATQNVTSADGTEIAFERTGDGPAVILIGGAFNDRSTVAALAAALAPQFTAVTYDRRGRERRQRPIRRGARVRRPRRPDRAPRRIGRRLRALLRREPRARGGPARDRGEQARGLRARVRRRRLPTPPGPDTVERLRTLVEQDRRDEAVTLFLTEQVAVPEPVVAGMRAEPVWAWFTGLAHTLPYDAAVCGQGPHLPTEALAAIDVPTLVLDGGESPAWMRAAAEAVAAAVPDGRYVTITGQDHGVLHHPAALLPALGEFLS